MTIGTALLVGTIVVVAIVMQRESGTGPVSENVGVSPGQANCEEIETFDEQDATHIDVGTPHDPYNSSPPTSGPHYEIPAETKFFPEQIPVEQVIHNMEHGQIVIFFQPDAESEIVTQVEQVVAQEPAATVAAPYTDIESPYQLVLTAWGALQRCEQVSQEVVDDFRREYQGEGPENLTPPFEG